MLVMQAVYWSTITVLHTKLSQINRASILLHITLTSPNSIGNTANCVVHGKHIILTGLSFNL